MSNTTEPTTITQGESYSWTRSFSDYPADEWDVQYRFRGPGQGFNVDATADDTRHAAEITSAMSGLAASGNYLWQAWATNIADDTIIREIASGQMTIRLGFPVNPTAGVETRSAAQIDLDAIDAALRAFTTSDVMEYEYETPAGRRKVKRSDKALLRSQRKDLAIRVSMERTKQRVENGGPLMRSVGIVVRES